MGDNYDQILVPIGISLELNLRYFDESPYYWMFFII
jgi:hypothetical protein